MKTTVAVLADYANVERSGKLNIMGIFDVINAPSVPCLHAQMNLVVRLVAEPSETGAPLPIDIQLINEDGQVAFGLKGEMAFPAAPAGELSTNDQILCLNNIGFERFGDYEFKILIRAEVVATIPFHVRQSKSSHR